MERIIVNASLLFSMFFNFISKLYYFHSLIILLIHYISSNLHYREYRREKDSWGREMDRKDSEVTSVKENLQVRNEKLIFIII